MTLDELAIKYNTDKSSKYHNYTPKYDQYFSPLRDQKIKVLEIGIKDGYSLKTWKDYFSKAEIFGIDIVDCHQMDEPRIKTIQGSQNDIAFLEEVNAKYGPFDIIIDDGSHISGDIRISFDCLFPLLKSGGLYVVEDLHCCYWPDSRERLYDFMDRLKELLDCVNSRGKSDVADLAKVEQDYIYKNRQYGEMTWWEKAIEYIHLYRSMVFIKKNQSSQRDDTFTPIEPPVKTLKVRRRIRSVIMNPGLAIETVLKRTSPTKPEPGHKGKVYDIFTFFNELSILEMRLNILNDYVDHFVIIESTETFSGQPKKLFYEENKALFKKFAPKIIHYVISDTPKNEAELRARLKKSNLPPLDRDIITATLNSDAFPHTVVHWLKEFFQKESIKKALTGLKDDDFCYISDVDEIWNPQAQLDRGRDDVFKLRQKFYMYYLNNRASLPWAGTLATKYKNIKNACLNDLRNPRKTKYTYIKQGGWHFYNQGDAEWLTEKIEASYGPEDLNTDEIKSKLNSRRQARQDYLGRKYLYWKDEASLPDYIRHNKAKYANFFK